MPRDGGREGGRRLMPGVLGTRCRVVPLLSFWIASVLDSGELELDPIGMQTETSRTSLGRSESLYLSLLRPDSTFSRLYRTTPVRVVAIPTQLASLNSRPKITMARRMTKTRFDTLATEYLQPYTQ